METEQAIRMLEPKMQSPYRILATKKQTYQDVKQLPQCRSKMTNLHPKKYK